MADAGAPTLTPGKVDVFTDSNGFWQQYAREKPATAIAAPASWTISATGAGSVISADESRRALVLWNTSSTATVYLRYDTTAPASTAVNNWHDQIPPQARLSVEKELLTLPVSMIGSAASGSIEIATA